MLCKAFRRELSDCRPKLKRLIATGWMPYRNGGYIMPPDTALGDVWRALVRFTACPGPPPATCKMHRRLHRAWALGIPKDAGMHHSTGPPIV